MLNTSTRLGAILAIGRLQADVFTAFARAEAAKSSGDYRAARPIYDRYVAEARTFLDATLAFNREFPDSPYEVPENPDYRLPTTERNPDVFAEQLVRDLLAPR